MAYKSTIGGIGLQQLMKFSKKYLHSEMLSLALDRIVNHANCSKVTNSHEIVFRCT